MNNNKEVFRSMPKVQQVALSTFNVVPLMVELRLVCCGPRPRRRSTSSSRMFRERGSRCTGAARNSPATTRMSIALDAVR